MTDRNTAEFKSLLVSLQGQLGAAIPEAEEYEQWQAERVRHLAELRALQAKIAAHAELVSGHKSELDELALRKQRSIDELNVVLNDVARRYAQLAKLDGELRGRR